MKLEKKEEQKHHSVFNKHAIVTNQMTLFKLKRYTLIVAAFGMWAQLGPGKEIKLQCKMKPEQCMTTLFAYFVSFRVVLINGTNRFREQQGNKIEKADGKLSFGATCVRTHGHK